MATMSPSVLIVTRDPAVKLVSAALQAEGIASRMVGNARDLQRALGGMKGRCVAVLDAELCADESFSMAEVLERVRDLPLLVLLPGDTDASPPSDPQRSSIEEYARKPITPSV